MSVNQATERPTTEMVSTEAGKLTGEIAGDVQRFLGIPFAAAGRWQAPEPHPPWTGVRAATAFGPDCPQPRGGVGGSRAPGQGEDCLVLNIWAPAGAAAGDKLPVMVWLYGGSFLFGSSSDPRIDGAALAGRGAVVITVNYRAGLFGFLAHPDLTKESEHGMSGNYGLLDVLAALRWVRGNVAGFGGDPACVTLFGVSAGGAIASLLQTSPVAAGLFDRAILESPGAMRPLARLPEAEAAGLTLGADIAALRALSWQDLVARTGELVPKMRGLTTSRILRPICDGWVVREDDRLAYGGGRFNAVPTIIGSAADEGGWATASWTVKSRDDWRKLTDEAFGDHAAEARSLYPAESDGEVPRRVGDLFADTQFNYGVWGVARALAAREPRTFRYLFARRAPGQIEGPHHGGEVSYVFDTLGVRGEAHDGDDAKVVDLVQRAWVRFAATGDPNGPGLPAWPRYTAAGDETLVIDEPPQVTSGHRAAESAFLGRFYAARDGG